MPDLYHYPMIAPSRAIRLLLHELGVQFEAVEIKPWIADRQFFNLNPAGTVPVLVIEGRSLCGAFAIAEYLFDVQSPAPGNGHQVWPGTAFERAEARRVADWFLSKFDADVSQYLVEEKVLKPLSGARHSPDLPAIRAARTNLRYHLDYVSYLADQRKWLGGDHMSFADFAAAGQISAMDYLAEIDWAAYPEAKSWYERIKSRPAFRPLLADRVPGLMPPPYYGSLDF